MTTKVVYLPLDERPCNNFYPQQVADHLKVQSVFLPWSRMFEVAFALETGGVR
ncbi:hypothetical protein [Fontibacillus phaseoli]|uniref:hypothetical protein n=1 Tax=Fontibacillus phaseoli TaxID=1416533 RepID=UPI0015F10FFB|nr:hypothetical protein [Fontibacillus phaseoli]